MEPASSEEDANLSALRESIQRKGNNSYYYAHSQKIEGPAWDGREGKLKKKVLEHGGFTITVLTCVLCILIVVEPRLLAVQTISTSSVKLRAQAFSSYAWTDEGKNVKLYIDFPSANEISDDNISAEKTSPESMEFSVRSTPTGDYKLLLDSLQGSIDEVSFRKKSDKFVVSLKKSVDERWYQLKKSSA
jgi:hypothetical protein